MASNISNIISQTGVQLEAQAFNTFGAVVQNTTNSVLSSVFGGNSGVTGTVGSATPGVWSPTPYASAFASGAGGFDPKLKFLFKVTFQFTPNVATQIASLLGIANASQWAANLTFAVKQIDLPKYNLEYEEVNMYNFRTKVLKMVRHEELSFSMYDTVGNHGLDFINAYLQVLMPASRQPYTSGYSLWDHGFAFTSSKNQGNDTGTRANLGSDGSSINILSTMQIDQYYLNRDHIQQVSGPTIANAILANSFIFTNPKLARFEVQDMDAEKGGEPNMINCTFDFDTLFIKEKQAGTAVNQAGPTMVDDILSGTGGGGFANSAGGGGNPYLNILAGGAGAAISSSVSTLLNKAGLTNVPGGVQSVAAIAGTLGTNAARTLASLGSTAPGISLNPTAILTDNSAPSSASAILSSQVS